MTIKGLKVTLGKTDKTLKYLYKNDPNLQKATSELKDLSCY